MWEEPVRGASGKASRKVRESVNPASTVGTQTAAGSCSAIHSRIVAVSGESIGERLPTTCSSHSIRYSPAPTTSAIASLAASCPSPGGTRQSTARRASDGITLILSDAKTRVGASDTPSIGSISGASLGSTARTRSSAAAGSSSPVEHADRLEERARLDGQAYDGWRAAKRSRIGPSFSSALSPSAGIAPCAATPSVWRTKRKTPFSAQPSE